MRFLKGRRKQYHLSPLKQDSECSERGLDPLYPTCWSRIFRPGHVIRDVVLGLLVLLGIAILVTVIFVLCFYVIPDEKEAFGKDLSGNAAGIFGREMFGGNEVEVVEIPEAGDSGPSSRYSEADTALKEEVREVLEEVLEDVLEVEEGKRGGAEETFVEEDLLQTPPAEGREIIEDFLSEIVEEEVVKPVSPEAAVWEEAIAPSCGVHQLAVCGGVAWWPNAMLPNHLNHTTKQMVQSSTILEDMKQCSPLAPLYTCALLEPPCGNSAPLPPCRPLCQEVARQCQHSAPDAAGIFDCRAFPDSNDPNICVGMPETIDLSPNFDATDEAHDIFSDRRDTLTASEEEADPLNPLYEGSNNAEADSVSVNPRTYGHEAATSADDDLAVCTMEMFMCDDGSDCMDQAFRCDGSKHCFDNSDELNCTQIVENECVGARQFHCTASQLCIPSSWLCDGADDCSDATDEANCNAQSDTKLRPTNDDNFLDTTSHLPIIESDQTNANDSEIPPVLYNEHDADFSSAYEEKPAGPIFSDLNVLGSSYQNDPLSTDLKAINSINSAVLMNPSKSIRKDSQYKHKYSNVNSNGVSHDGRLKTKHIDDHHETEHSVLDDNYDDAVKSDSDSDNIGTEEDTLIDPSNMTPSRRLRESLSKESMFSKLPPRRVGPILRQDAVKYIATPTKTITERITRPPSRYNSIRTTQAPRVYTPARRKYNIVRRRTENSVTSTTPTEEITNVVPISSYSPDQASMMSGINERTLSRSNERTLSRSNERTLTRSTPSRTRTRSRITTRLPSSASTEMKVRSNIDDMYVGNSDTETGLKEKTGGRSTTLSQDYYPSSPSNLPTTEKSYERREKITDMNDGITSDVQNINSKYNMDSIPKEEISETDSKYESDYMYSDYENDYGNLDRTNEYDYYDGDYDTNVNDKKESDFGNQEEMETAESQDAPSNFRVMYDSQNDHKNPGAYDYGASADYDSYVYNDRQQN